MFMYLFPINVSSQVKFRNTNRLAVSCYPQAVHAIPEDCRFSLGPERAGASAWTSESALLSPWAVFPGDWSTVK